MPYPPIEEKLKDLSKTVPNFASAVKEYIEGKRVRINATKSFKVHSGDTDPTYTGTLYEASFNMDGKLKNIYAWGHDGAGYIWAVEKKPKTPLWDNLTLESDKWKAAQFVHVVITDFTRTNSKGQLVIDSPRDLAAYLAHFMPDDIDWQDAYARQCAWNGDLDNMPFF